MALGHCRALLQAGHERALVAVADINEQRAAALQSTARIRLAAHTDYRDLLARADIDAVFIATPNHLHREHACAAFAAGKHVFLEKPMALTLTECDAILAAAAEADRVLQIGLVYRYSPLFREMERLIRSGRIGVPVMAWCHEFRVPFPVGRDREWRYSQALSGGALVEKSCHHFDLFQWLLDAVPVRVHAIGGQTAVRRDGAVKPGVPTEPYELGPGAVNDIIDHAWVNVEYDNATKGNLGLSLFTAGRSMPVGVLGTGGWIEACVPRKLLRVHDGRAGCIEELEPLRKAHEPADVGHTGGTRQVKAFLEAIEAGATPFADGQVGRASILAGLAAELSIRRQRVVEVDELELAAAAPVMAAASG